MPDIEQSPQPEAVNGTCKECGEYRETETGGEDCGGVNSQSECWDCWYERVDLPRFATCPKCGNTDLLVIEEHTFLHHVYKIDGINKTAICDSFPAEEHSSLFVTCNEEDCDYEFHVGKEDVKTMNILFTGTERWLKALEEYPPQEDFKLLGET